MSKQITDYEVEKAMCHFLYMNLVADNKQEIKEGLRGVVDGREIIIINPVKTRLRYSLDDKVKENSSHGVATAFVLPKSSSSYDVNYLREPTIKDKFSQGGIKRWHNSVDLTTAERYLIDTFGNSVSYFNPVNRQMDHLKFKRHPEWFIAAKCGVGLVPDYDCKLLDEVERLRETHGKGHIAENMHMRDVIRYGALKNVKDHIERIREKLCDKSRLPIKGLFGVEVYRAKNGILAAKLVPYEPELKQGELF